MHTTLHRLQRRARMVAVSIAASSMVLGNVASVSAATLSSTSLELSDPRPDETAVDYTYSAAGLTTGTNIQCVVLQLNDAADGAGAIPSNITTTTSTFNTGTMLSGTWNVDNTTNGTLQATSAVGVAPSASGNVVWGNITNGDTEATTYYGIFTTYTDGACTGGNEVDTAIVAFVYKAGELVELTIAPTLTFVCAAVAAAQTVNGATTTHASGASGIDFGQDVTASANGISAHDLTATTNAAGGYTVYVRHTGQLTNGAGDTIDNHTGTNAAPTAFPAAGTEAWGYTTDDAVLEAVAVDRFTSAGGDKWAGFTTSNEEVMYNAAAVPSSETQRVGHQVGIDATTEAGTYQSTIVYTVVATF